jgi:hypothetical protein
LSVTRTIAAGHTCDVSFSIDGYGNDFAYYAPQVVIYRLVRDGATQLGKASVTSVDGTYYYHYYNAKLSIQDNGFTPDGVTAHTWTVQFWISNDYAGNTESTFVEDRNVQVTELGQ